MLCVRARRVVWRSLVMLLNVLHLFAELVDDRFKLRRRVTSTAFAFEQRVLASLNSARKSSLRPTARFIQDVALRQREREPLQLSFFDVGAGCVAAPPPDAAGRRPRLSPYRTAALGVLEARQDRFRRTRRRGSHAWRHSSICASWSWMTSTSRAPARRARC